MKLNKLLVAALAAMTLVSCNKDENVPQEVQPERGETTLARITLTQAAPSTYAHYGNLTPTAEESIIKTATLYIFDNTRVLEKVESFTFGSGVTTTSAFEITTGQKYFYIAVNMDSFLPGFSENVSTILDVKNGITTTPIISIQEATDDTADGFWMTSMEEVSETLQAATEADTDPTGSAINNIEIPVGRAVAKVGLHYDESSAVQQSAGKLTQVKYKVHNNPKKVYLISNYDNVSGLLKTPFYNATTLVPANYFDNGTYMQSGIQTVGTDDYYKEPSYMMENSNQVPTQGNATFLMIQGVYTPDVVYDEDGENPVAGVEGNDFYRIKMADGSYTSKFYFEQPDNDVTNLGATSWVKYTGGKSYYGLWLKDNSKSSPECYTIPRNTYFGVTITSVSGPGESDEDDVVTDPDENLDEDTYMRAEIKVLNWAKVEQSGGI